MNHLAHLALSGTDSNVIVGNLVTDYLSLKSQQELDAALVHGVKLHRFIDYHADQHPAFKEALRMMYPIHGKYASVVLDVYFDGILCRYWDRYEDISLRAFADLTYERILSRLHLLEPALASRFENMIRSDWLVRYQYETGLAQTFHGLSRRASFPNRFGEAAHAFEALAADLIKHFDLIWPDMKSACADFLESTILQSEERE